MSKPSVPNPICYMLFHAWVVQGQLSTEILEQSVTTGCFKHLAKDDYEKEATELTPEEWLSEVWSDGCYAKELTGSVASEAQVDEGEDRYFEFYAEYGVTIIEDYFGEQSLEEEISKPYWQEISSTAWEE